MVKIRHINGDEKFVTKGAFEGIFKPLGYELVAKKKNKDIDDKKEIIDDKKEQNKVDEKPIDKQNDENKDKRK